MLNGLMMASSGNLKLGSIVSLTNTDSIGTLGAGNTSWSPSIGTAPSGDNRRYVAIAVGLWDNDGDNITSPTFNGSPGNVAVETNNGEITTKIWWAEVASGTSVTVGWTGSAGDDFGMSAYSIITEGELSVLNTDTDYNISVNNTNWVWTGLTKDVGLDVRTDEWFSSASFDFTGDGSGAKTFSATGGSNSLAFSITITDPAVIIGSAQNRSGGDGIGCAAAFGFS